MGKMKAKWMDNQERRQDALLAKVLRITLDELDSTTWEFDENETDDGVLTGVTVRFSEGSKEILKKIGVNSLDEITIDPNALSNAEHMYIHYAKILKVDYRELIYTDTEELDFIEKDGVPGINLRFSPNTSYEFLSKIKHNGLTDDYQTWLPFQ